MTLRDVALLVDKVPSFYTTEWDSLETVRDALPLTAIAIITCPFFWVVSLAFTGAVWQDKTHGGVFYCHLNKCLIIHIIVAHGHLTQPMCPNLQQYIANCLCLPFLCNEILLSTAKQMHLGNMLYFFQYSSPVTVTVRTEIFASITFILGKQKKSMTSSRRREAVGKAR